MNGDDPHARRLICQRPRESSPRGLCALGINEDSHFAIFEAFSHSSSGHPLSRIAICTNPGAFAKVIPTSLGARSLPSTRGTFVGMRLDGRSLTGGRTIYWPTASRSGFDLSCSLPGMSKMAVIDRFKRLAILLKVSPEITV